MPIPVIRYQLDPTGLNSDNYVAAEPHVLANVPLRAVIPTYGAFYTESLKVYDAATTRLLVRGTDYVCTELASDPSGLYGKEICYIILITNSAVSSNVTLNYQVLGGLYGRSTEAILGIYNLIINGNSSASWNGILNKPSEFNPAAHLHDINDVYGFEYVVNALERVRSAILIGSTPEFQNILKYIDDQVVIMRNSVSASQNANDNHALLKTNPHVVTKAQVGLSNVANLPVAQATDINTVINAAPGTVVTSDKYVTMSGLIKFKNENTSASGDTLSAAKAYADQKDAVQLQVTYQAIADNTASVNILRANGDSSAILTAKTYTDTTVASGKADAINTIRAKGIRYAEAGGIALQAATNNVTISQTGRWFEIQATDSVTTLPDIGTMQYGEGFTFTCNRPKAVIQSFSATQLIIVAGSAHRQIGIRISETITLTANGAHWHITSVGSPNWTLTPVGGIIFYDGLLSDLPANWKVCDGTNGTPNLTNRFVVGANGRFALGSSGGSADAVVVSHGHGVTSTFTGNALGGHSHGVNDPTHGHSIADPGHLHHTPLPSTWSANGSGGVNFHSGSVSGASGYNGNSEASGTGIGIYGNYTGISIQASAAGTPSGSVATSISSSGVSGTDANLPPWYSLYYIKRIY